MQQFHHQMGLAHGGPARHGCADGRRDGWVQKIHIERDMQQAVRRRDPGKEIGQRCLDPALVNGAHVDICDIAALKCRMFGTVDGPQTDHADVLRRHHGGQGREGVKPVAPRHISHGRAVHISAVGAVRRVKIGMRIKPKHKQRPVLVCRMRRHPRDRAKRERVIATQKDRHSLLGRVARGS